MLFFMCCYCGVYPWGLLRPRSTKTAVTVLLQVHSVRRTSGAPMRLSICGLPAAKRTAKRAAVPRRGAPVACKSSPLSTSGKILKNFGQRALSDGYFTQRNLQKTTRYSRHTLKAQSEGHYGSKTDGPAAKSRRLSTPRAPQALTVRGCFTGCPSAT